MLTSTYTADHVLIFSLSNEVTEADIDQAYDVLTEKLRGGGAVNMYVELMGDFSIEGGALLKDFARAHEVLGKMKQFDRIAVVAAKPWVRAIARIESAAFALIDLNMQVYAPEERKHALAWANGDASQEHADAIRAIDTDQAGIYAFEVDGKIRAQDLHVIKEFIADINASDQPVGLLARFTRFSGFEMALLADTELASLKRDAIGKIGRYAVVGAPDWIETTIDTIGKALPLELRTYDADDENEAWAWLKLGTAK